MTDYEKILKALKKRFNPTDITEKHATDTMDIIIVKLQSGNQARIRFYKKNYVKTVYRKVV